MIERKTVVELIEIPREGGIQVRMAFLLVEDGRESFEAWHRSAVPEGVSLPEQFQFIQDHLVEMGKAPLLQEDIDRAAMFYELATSLPSPTKPTQQEPQP